MNSKTWDIKSTIVDGNWTLFLDRDGVINRRIVDGYVTSWDEFEFLPGVLEAFTVFSKKFKRVFIVTNQQGIGKGLMSSENLMEIHKQLFISAEGAGCKIDAAYYCPDLAASNSPNRKPMPGMAFQAKSEFPDIELKKSIMVGDSNSDMEFALNAGLKSVFIGDGELKVEVDAQFGSLSDFSKSL